MLTNIKQYPHEKTTIKSIIDPIIYQKDRFKVYLYYLIKYHFTYF